LSAASDDRAMGVYEWGPSRVASALGA